MKGDVPAVWSDCSELVSIGYCCAWAFVAWIAPEVNQCQKAGFTLISFLDRNWPAIELTATGCGWVSTGVSESRTMTHWKGVKGQGQNYLVQVNLSRCSVQCFDQCQLIENRPRIAGKRKTRHRRNESLRASLIVDKALKIGNGQSSFKQVKHILLSFSSPSTNLCFNQCRCMRKQVFWCRCRVRQKRWDSPRDEWFTSDQVEPRRKEKNLRTNSQELTRPREIIQVKDPII